jgi:hypothetical protein
MNVEYSRVDRQPILVRKVMTATGKRRGGIYDENGNPVDEIIPGELYRARLDRKLMPVVARHNQVMYPIEPDIEDPRVRATEAEAKTVGFDLSGGTYHYPR